MTGLFRNNVLGLLLCGIALTACGKKEVVAAAEPPAPKPLKVYAKDGIAVNAYDFSGLEYFLNRKNDTTYVVNFWATWCVPCVAELPHFEKLSEKYKNEKVKVLLVSLDMSSKVETSLIPFIKEKQLKPEVLFLKDPDQNTWVPKVDPAWSGAIPATVIYNKSRCKFYEKSFTYEELEKEVSNFK
jgi:thiol-disulfide isomerase/thioredoxin